MNKISFAAALVELQEMFPSFGEDLLADVLRQQGRTPAVTMS